MKANYIFLLVLLWTATATAQQKDWQWIKQGGASIEGDEPEQVYDIATDGDRNVYMVSAMGFYNLKIDGNTKTYYGGPGGSLSNYTLASFACDGSYSWSKIIGGRGHQVAPYIETDSNDNLYMVGSSYACEGYGYPFRIENDTILSNNTDHDCSLGYIAKFDKSGNMLWFKQPMDRDSISTLGGGANKFGSYNTSIDKNNGIVHWLVNIPPGSYDSGNFINTRQGNNWHVFKYNSAGNFLGAVYFDIQLSAGVAGLSLKMYRNPHNGYYYFTGRRYDAGVIPGTATVGGQDITGSFYMACFDPQGNFQWLREDTYSQPGPGGSISAIDFDKQNNIYLGLVFVGFGYENFLGFSIPEQSIPGLVMKTNPDASKILWASYHKNAVTAFPGNGFAVKGDKVYYTNQGAGHNFAWGNQSVDINTIGDGSDVILASFDKNTGDCNNLSFIKGNPGHNDLGTALTVDANDDVLVGGEFKHTLYDANGGQVMNPNPSNTNFFIAKYATEPCPELGTNSWETQNIKVWPNPVSQYLYVSVLVPNTYHLYDITGKLIREGKLKTGENSLNIKALSPGLYLLQTTGERGNKQVHKVVKE